MSTFCRINDYRPRFFFLKINMTGIGIFDGKKYEDMTPSTHNMSVPTVKRTEYQVNTSSFYLYSSLFQKKKKAALLNEPKRNISRGLMLFFLFKPGFGHR